MADYAYALQVNGPGGPYHVTGDAYGARDENSVLAWALTQLAEKENVPRHKLWIKAFSTIKTKE